MTPLKTGGRFAVLANDVDDNLRLAHPLPEKNDLSY
jgi:hypothetical protein